jgi:hypothetical protein
MNKSSYNRFIILIFSLLIISSCFTNCLKTGNSTLLTQGTFPDTVINMVDINSAYDDYNVTLNQFTGSTSVIFSSNRKSSGGQFDLEQANFSFIFDRTNGNFNLSAAMTNDVFLNRLITKAETPRNDFGPFRLFSSVDGFEYLLLSSVNTNGNLDLYYLKNRPVYNSGIPEVQGPFPIKLLNTIYDDAYICFDLNLDSAYFITNKDGNFDIFLQKRPAEKKISEWFDMTYAVSTSVDNVNSSSDDKCPLVLNNIMVFTSNRPGGSGGFDLYYSVFKKGSWSSAVNFGPGINTSSDEYRPVLGYHPDFANLFMMFSSNRPGGIGGFDLYFSGVKFPKK